MWVYVTNRLTNAHRRRVENVTNKNDNIHSYMYTSDSEAVLGAKVCLGAVV